jgi:hypothetical protein
MDILLRYGLQEFPIAQISTPATMPMFFTIRVAQTS